MFAIGDSVRACVEDVYRIGTVEEVIINPGTKIVSYMVTIPFINEYIEFFEDELISYQHSHISNSFSRKSNETRQSDSGNN